jgi:hypothetical protein
MSCENWATVSDLFAKDALRSAILAAVLRVGPDNCDGFAILPSLIRLMDDPAFSQDVFSEIAEWIKPCLANPNPGVVPDAVWFLFRALASAPFEGFCGDLQALAADLERPDDDVEWFCGERPPSFLRNFLVPLAFCPDASVIPHSSLLSFSRSGLGWRPSQLFPLLQHRCLGVSGHSSPAIGDSDVVARVSSPSRAMYRRVGRLFSFRGETVFGLSRRRSRWPVFSSLESARDGTNIRRTGLWQRAPASSSTTLQKILTFLQKLIAVSQSHDMPAHPFLGVVHVVYELWELSERDKDEAYRLLSLLARGFVGSEIQEEVVSAWVCPTCAEGRIGSWICPS